MFIITSEVSLMLRLSLYCLALCTFTVAQAQESPQPPTAQIKPKEIPVNGDKLIDNYFYLREKTNPDVISYLEKENAYTETMMKSTEALQEKLYKEFLGRIPERTPLTVLSADDPKRRRVGFSIFEQIGIGVHNPLALTRILIKR